MKGGLLFEHNHKIADNFFLSESIVVFPGDCLDLMHYIPDESLQLIVTSPPYNIGKEYERKLYLERISKNSFFRGAVFDWSYLLAV